MNDRQRERDGDAHKSRNIRGRSKSRSSSSAVRPSKRQSSGREREHRRGSKHGTASRSRERSISRGSKSTRTKHTADNTASRSRDRSMSRGSKSTRTNRTADDQERSKRSSKRRRRGGSRRNRSSRDSGSDSAGSIVIGAGSNSGDSDSSAADSNDGNRRRGRYRRRNRQRSNSSGSGSSMSDNGGGKRDRKKHTKEKRKEEEEVEEEQRPLTPDHKEQYKKKHGIMGKIEYSIAELKTFGQREKIDRFNKAIEAAQPAPAPAPALRDWPLTPFHEGGASYVLDTQTSFYYDPESGFYYGLNADLYYSTAKAAYFRYNRAASSFAAFVPAPPTGPPPFSSSSSKNDVATSNSSTGTQQQQQPMGLLGVSSNVALPGSIKPVVKKKKAKKTNMFQVSITGQSIKRANAAATAAAAATAVDTASQQGTWQSVSASTETSDGNAKRKTTSDPVVATKVTNVLTASLKPTHALPPAQRQQQKQDVGKWNEARKPVCVLCRRKFANLAQLDKHERLSELHKTNLLAKQAKQEAAAASDTSSDTGAAAVSAASDAGGRINMIDYAVVPHVSHANEREARQAVVAAGYKDRAAERRERFGQDGGTKMIGESRRQRERRKAAEDEANEAALQRRQELESRQDKSGGSSGGNGLTHSTLLGAGADKPLDDTNKGSQLLKALGWKEGEGLGKSGTGITAPIDAAVQLGTSGLGRSAAVPGGKVQQLPGDSRRDVLRKQMKQRLLDAERQSERR